jgi:hypothetical protein
MPTRTLETDYLVIGCGAAGMAFTDALLDASPQADIVMVDRRHAPGGHWLEAYPFVRLHQPSAYYGVNSMPLGNDTLDTDGPNSGMYERAGVAEICGYFDRVMRQRFLPSGRVRWFPMSRWVGDRIVSSLSGEEIEVRVRKKLVDTSYLEGRFPASSPPPFEVDAGVRCVPVGALADLRERPAGYVIVGAGKTALDAITWLVDSGVAPSNIRWIKSREAWFYNRRYLQGGALVGTMLEGLALQLEAAAQASSAEDLFARLEASEQLVRVDEKITPTMFRAPTLSIAEVEQLRRIEDVVRLGRVRRIEADRIVLDGGTVPTSREHLHVHCAAEGLNAAPETPIFTADRITLQSIRIGLLPFASALVAYVEATRDDVAAKNRLCPPSRQPNVPLDWARGMLISMRAANRWSKEPDITDWLERSRLNLMRGLPQRVGDPDVQQSFGRFLTNVRPALASLERLCAELPAVP